MHLWMEIVVLIKASYMQADRQAGGQACMQAGREGGRHASRQAGREAGR